MNVYNVYCNEKKGYWKVLAQNKEEAIKEITKSSDLYTNLIAIKVN